MFWAFVFSNALALVCRSGLYCQDFCRKFFLTIFSVFWLKIIFLRLENFVFEILQHSLNKTNLDALFFHLAQIFLVTSAFLQLFQPGSSILFWLQIFLICVCRKRVPTKRHTVCQT